MNLLCFVCDRDIYLLDNPLSMVDADTAGEVFDRCILKALHGRTVILATQQVQVEASFQAECFISFVLVVRPIYSNCCTWGYYMKGFIKLAY
jgi:ABC-type transport system involved in cytochrome bd biosynthesis fused ATPase/permease subunit